MKTPFKREKRSSVPSGMLVLYIANGSPENSYLVRLPVLDWCSIPHLMLAMAWFSLLPRTTPNMKSRWFDDCA